MLWFVGVWAVYRIEPPDLLELSTPSKGKETETRAHQKGLEELISACDALGLVRLKMQRAVTHWFVPDLQVSVGPRNQDRVLVEYVASVSSYKRDFGSMVLLRSSNDGEVRRLARKWDFVGAMGHAFRRYVLVVADEIWFKVPTFIGDISGGSTERGLRLFDELNGLTVISRKYFSTWLAAEVKECAEEVMEAKPVDFENAEPEDVYSVWTPRSTKQRHNYE